MLGKSEEDAWGAARLARSAFCFCRRRSPGRGEHLWRRRGTSQGRSRESHEVCHSRSVSLSAFRAVPTSTGGSGKAPVSRSAPQPAACKRDLCSCCSTALGSHFSFRTKEVTVISVLMLLRHCHRGKARFFLKYCAFNKIPRPQDEDKPCFLVGADAVGKLEPTYLSVTKTLNSHFLKVDLKTAF